MNKTDLIGSVSEETTFSKKDVTKIFEAMTRIITRTLKKGEKVQLSGFGTFLLSVRAERWGINPKDKSRLRLPKTIAPKFKAGKQFKEQVRTAAIKAA